MHEISACFFFLCFSLHLFSLFVRLNFSSKPKRVEIHKKEQTKRRKNANIRNKNIFLKKQKISSAEFYRNLHWLHFKTIHIAEIDRIRTTQQAKTEHQNRNTFLYASGALPYNPEVCPMLPLVYYLNQHLLLAFCISMERFISSIHKFNLHKFARK